MLTVIKEMSQTVKKEKKYVCKYCTNGFTTTQALSRHTLHNVKCLTKYPRDIMIVSKMLQEDNSGTKCNNSEIIMLTKRLELLKNGESDTERTIRMLTEQNQQLTNDNLKLTKELAVVKPFYIRNMLSDADTLIPYIEPTDTLVFEKYLMNKYSENRLHITKNMVYAIHDFFVPKYWRHVNIREGQYKYRDSNGDIVIDNKLTKLYSIVKPLYSIVMANVLLDMRVNNVDCVKEEEIYFKLIADTSPVNIDFFQRMTCIDDAGLAKSRRQDAKNLYDMLEEE